MFEDNSFNYKSDKDLPKSFAGDYLRQYYVAERGVSTDEQAVFKFILKIKDRLPQAAACLEVGCGPTVHHALMLAPYVESLTLADYLENNLTYVDAWLKNQNNAWDWSAYTKYCLGEEGISPSTENINRREELTRSRIKSLRGIDILSPSPLGDDNAQFDLVAAFYCTEEVALTLERWKEVVLAVSTLVKKDGSLLISCLESSNYYHICDANNHVRELPCAQVTENDLRNVLQEVGFDVSNSVIETFRTPSQADEGVPGVVLGLARKIRG